jgi:hypothetical protein
MSEVNQSIESAKSVAGMIPVVGSIAVMVGNIAASLGIKGKTTHLTWAEADALARPYADNVIAALQNSFSLNDDESLKKLWITYQARMSGFIMGDSQGSTWWDDTTRVLYWNAFTYELPRSTQRESLWYCLWLSSHWIYENIDGIHIDSEGADKLKYVAEKVLIPALTDAGFAPTAKEAETVAVIAGTPKAVAGVSPVNTASLFGSNQTILIIAGVVLLVGIAVSHQKGGAL